MPRKPVLTSSLGGLFEETPVISPQSLPEPPPVLATTKDVSEPLEEAVAILEPAPQQVEPALTEWQKIQARVRAFIDAQVSVTPLDDYGEPIPERVDITVVIDGKAPDREASLRTLKNTTAAWEHNSRTFWRTTVTIPEDCWEASAREQAQRVCNKLIISHLEVTVYTPERAWGKQVKYNFYLSPDSNSRFMNDEDFERLRRK